MIRAPTPTASIVVPTQDKLSRLRLVMQALDGQITDQVEVIVVFDRCAAATLEGFDATPLSFQPVKVVLEGNGGRAAARNIGVRRSRGEIIVFLDDDRMPAPDFVARHLAGHRGRDCVLLGGRRSVLYEEGQLEALHAAGAVRSDFSGVVARATPDAGFHLLNDWILRDPKHPLRWLPFFTGNASVKRSFLEQVGAFDENYRGWGYEDTDLGYRLCRLGLEFVQDRQLVNYHLVHAFDARQVRIEEKRNMRYLVSKFPQDRALRVTLELYQLLRRFAFLKHLYESLVYRGRGPNSYSEA